jgi:hypothetical protein
MGVAMKELKVGEMLEKIEEFKSTLGELSKNMDAFKDKIIKNAEKYGQDIAKWPQQEDDK